MSDTCLVCGTDRPPNVLYPERLPAGAVSPQTFGARRAPDRVHARIRQCRDCGFLAADPVVDTDALGALYERSGFTYRDEVASLRRTYGRHLRAAAEVRPGASRLLEIGCGNGFMLQEAIQQGYRDVVGVEPSEEAIQQAPEPLRPRIRQGLFDPEQLDGQRFDVVCAFQVFDHLPDPVAFLNGVRRVLEPDGVLLLVLHDARAWSSRLLGERSPIFDLAHPYLYDRRTLPRLLERHAWHIRRVFTVWNTFRLLYWAHLAPLPPAAKTAVQKLLERTGLGRWTVTIPVGNFGVIAQHAG